VDDDESIHLLLQPMLKPFAACDYVLTGEAGLELFCKAQDQGNPYDVVLMDILMPGMDGHQAAQAMRAQEKERKVERQDQFKLVMITSLVDDINVSRAFFQAKASCYIVKPLDKIKVLDELRQNLII
jgi:two-component system chemotaxis response regulator CheY